MTRTRRLVPLVAAAAAAVTACSGHGGAAGAGAAAAGTPVALHASTAVGTSAPATSPPPSATVSSPVGGGSAGTDGAVDGGTPAATPTRTAPVVHDITLAFAGDVHFMGVDAGRLAADPATAIGPMTPLLRSADLAMVNLETAITTRGTPAHKKYVFRAPATAFTALRDAGIDVVTMANNHGEDYGPVGLADSLAAAHAAHFPVVGIGADVDAAFAPWLTTVKGRRVAVIGATQVLDNGLAAAWTAGPGRPGLASAKDVPRLLDAVRAARAKADLVVVYLHWGVEMRACPTSTQETLAQQLTAAGADVVVGSHAHVQLGAGRLGSAYVDYGLGNFVFYAAGGVTSRSGVLLLTLSGRTVKAARWAPAVIRGGVATPLPAAAAPAAVAQWDALRGCTGLAPQP